MARTAEVKHVLKSESGRYAVCRRLFGYIWVSKSQKPLKNTLSSGYTRLLLILAARQHPNLKKYDWQLAAAYFTPSPDNHIWRSLITEGLNRKGGPRLLRQRWYYYDNEWSDEDICAVILTGLGAHGVTHLHGLTAADMAAQMHKIKYQVAELLCPIIEVRNLTPEDVLETEVFRLLIKIYLELEDELKATLMTR